MLDYVGNIREIEGKLGSFMEDDPEKGRFRVARDIFTDPDLFELEMKHIWEGNWIYLAHETQIPNKNDYFTMYMGRQPIFIARNRNGELNAFINACSHRGAMLCRHKQANKSTYTCPFHGWTFNNSGKLLKVKDPEGAGYPEGFNRDGSHDLTKVPRFESYRGFLFGSLNPDVKPLKEHLGEAAKIIDMIVDQSPEGLEVLRGSSTYIYDGNWKLQTENGADGYHVSAVHWNYAATTSRRKAGREGGPRQGHGRGRLGQAGRRILLLRAWPSAAVDELVQPGGPPELGSSGELAQAFGEAQRDWMVQRSRNLCLYPNVYLMDQFSSQIRHLPADLGRQDRGDNLLHRAEGRERRSRARRIRQYEDFFNATGMATPDDLEEFRSCQIGMKGRARAGTTCRRGAKHWIKGPTKLPRRSALNP